MHLSKCAQHTHFLAVSKYILDSSKYLFKIETSVVCPYDDGKVELTKLTATNMRIYLLGFVQLS